MTNGSEYALSTHLFSYILTMGASYVLYMVYGICVPSLPFLNYTQSI